MVDTARCLRVAHCGRLSVYEGSSPSPRAKLKQRVQVPIHQFKIDLPLYENLSG